MRCHLANTLAVSIQAVAVDCSCLPVDRRFYRCSQRRTIVRCTNCPVSRRGVDDASRPVDVGPVAHRLPDSNHIADPAGRRSLDSRTPEPILVVAKPNADCRPDVPDIADSSSS